MRQVPVFADRFWELKPRRNELRAQVGAEWCGRMRYGTECEPVFTHGIPDGWRERWRLIREFTERWHRVPMPDIGGRQAEIAEAEKRLGRTLPPAVREWIAFAHDVRRDSRYHDVFWHQFIFDSVPGQPAVSILWDGQQGGDVLYGVRDTDSHESDPPVYDYVRDADTGTFALNLAPLERFPLDQSVTAFAFRNVNEAFFSGGYFWNTVVDIYSFLKEAKRLFPVSVNWCEVEVYETSTICLVVLQPPRWHGPSVLLLAHPTPAVESLPEFLQVLIPPPTDDPIPF